MAAFVPAASVVAPAVQVDAPEIVMESVLAAAMDVRGTVPEIAGAVPDVPEAVLVLGSGCSGSCQGTCQNSCSASCTSTCTGTCTSCTGTCSGGCQTNCQGQCDNACTADSEAEIIAHLGDNIAIGHIVRAWIIPSLKTRWITSIAAEEKRSERFIKQPIPGEPVSLEITQKVLTDVYEFDKLPEHDWRETFGLWDMASAPKWNPVIVHIKSLMTDIATS